MSFILKTNLNDDLRRVALTHTPDLKEIFAVVQKQFALPYAPVLKYTDADGDFITIECSSDLEEALSLSMGKLYLHAYERKTNAAVDSTASEFISESDEPAISKAADVVATAAVATAAAADIPAVDASALTAAPKRVCRCRRGRGEHRHGDSDHKARVLTPEEREERQQRNRDRIAARIAARAEAAAKGIAVEERPRRMRGLHARKAHSDAPSDIDREAKRAAHIAKKAAAVTDTVSDAAADVKRTKRVLTAEELEHREQRKRERIARYTARTSADAAAAADGVDNADARRAARESARAERDAKKTIRADKQAERAVRRVALDKLKASFLESIPEGVRRIIVDGNNIMGGGPHRMKRATLVRLVCEYVRAHPQLSTVDVVVMFDGAEKELATDVSNARIAFSGADRIADDVIVDMVSVVAAPVPTVVVTSDRGLGLRLLEREVQVMRSGWFARMIDPEGAHARGREGRKPAVAAATVAASA